MHACEWPYFLGHIGCGAGRPHNDGEGVDTGMYKARSLRELRTNSDIWPLNVKLGMWAWFFQRITGLALVFYVLLHIVLMSSSIWGGTTFDFILAILQSPFFLVLDLFLILAVLYHGLNGIRIVLFDLGIGVRRQKAVLGAILAVVAVIFAYSIIIIVPHVFAA